MCVNEYRGRYIVRKKCLASILLVFLAFSASITFASLSIITKAATTAVLSLKPSMVPTQGFTIGSTFDITVHVDNVQNLWQWVFLLSWNPAVLTVESGPTEGLFLRSAGSTFFNAAPKINLTRGILDETSSTLMSLVSASGSGDLATVKFKVVGYGSTEIKFFDLPEGINALGGVPPTLDSSSPRIDCTLVNSTFNLADPNPLPSPPPSTDHGPIANFVPADGASLSKAQPIILDASQSAAGHDSVGANETCPITNYAWRIEYLNGTVFKSLSGKIVNLTATTTDDLRIILIVTAPDPHPPSSTIFADTDTKSAVIHVTLAGSSMIDVFLDKGGRELNVSSGSYGPNELVQIFALVTYSNSPVTSIDVAFSVYDSHSALSAVRIGRTNSTGIANVEFRLPMPDTDPNSVYGAWLVMASASVTETSVKDIVSFNYTAPAPLSIKEIQVPTTIYKLTNTPINITFNCGTQTTLWFSITVYDAKTVPVGFYAVSNVQVQGDKKITVNISLPSWVFTGQATLYVDALTKSPDTGGVPYLPERSVNFQLAD